MVRLYSAMQHHSHLTLKLLVIKTANCRETTLNKLDFDDNKYFHKFTN